MAWTAPNRLWTPRPARRGSSPPSPGADGAAAASVTSTRLHLVPHRDPFVVTARNLRPHERFHHGEVLDEDAFLLLWRELVANEVSRLGVRPAEGELEPVFRAEEVVD